MKQEGMTPSEFADETGIERAALSHIFSGRCKPNLDIIHKILERFTWVNPEWLINGNGNMRRESNQ